jgi:hypothetical protein
MMDEHKVAHMAGCRGLSVSTLCVIGTFCFMNAYRRWKITRRCLLSPWFIIDECLSGAANGR